MRTKAEAKKLARLHKLAVDLRMSTYPPYHQEDFAMYRALAAVVSVVAAVKDIPDFDTCNMSDLSQASDRLDAAVKSIEDIRLILQIERMRKHDDKNS